MRAAARLTRATRYCGFSSSTRLKSAKAAADSPPRSRSTPRVCSATGLFGASSMAFTRSASAPGMSPGGAPRRRAVQIRIDRIGIGREHEIEIGKRRGIVLREKPRHAAIEARLRPARLAVHRFGECFRGRREVAGPRLRHSRQECFLGDGVHHEPFGEPRIPRIESQMRMTQGYIKSGTVSRVAA